MSFSLGAGLGKTAVSILIDERQQDFDAIITVNDKMAVGVLAELQARGFIVPQHKAVVGFDDDQTTSPPLTTVYLPFFEMGQLALETCVSLIRQLPVPEFVEMPAQLTVRRSCGCLPQGLEDAWTVLLPRRGLRRPAMDLCTRRSRAPGRPRRSPPRAHERQQPDPEP